MLKPLIEHRAWRGLKLLYFPLSTQFSNIQNTSHFVIVAFTWEVHAPQSNIIMHSYFQCLHSKTSFSRSHSRGTCWSVRRRASVVSCASTLRIWWWDPSANSPSSSGTSSSWGRLTGNSGTFWTRSCAGSAPHAHHSHTHTLSTRKIPYCHQWVREQPLTSMKSLQWKTLFRLYNFLHTKKTMVLLRTEDCLRS